MNYLIDKAQFISHVQSLKGYTILAPVAEKNGDLAFNTLNNGAKAALDFKNTPRSPKCVFLPMTEVMMRYEMGKQGLKSVKSTPLDATKRVILGIRPCDLAAIPIMKKLFRSEDTALNARIDNTTLVTLNCNDKCNDRCFCSAVGTGPFAEKNYDVALTDLGSQYLVEVASPKGEAIMKSLKAPAKAGDADLKKKKELNAAAAKSIPIQFNAEGVEKKLVASDPVWKEKGKACMRCGGCNYACPTCVCFNVIDQAGERKRIWDGCLLSGFTLLAGGENPRDELSDRIIQRYFHKFQYTKVNDNYYSCVGCGRCSKVCLFNDNMGQTLKELNAK